jgi:transposase
MRRAIPPIIEHSEDLKQRLQHEQDRRKKPRLHMLYLLVTGQAQTRQQVAALLGISRNTVGHWLALYEAGGLAALLNVYVPPGKRPSLAPEVLASIEQALRQPDGFASYGELRHWIEQTHQVRVKYKTLYSLVRTKFKAKLKVPRPSHTKKR